MTEKEKIIEAIKNLDFNELKKLLDDNKSYMDVSKDLFLSTLKHNIKQYKDLKSYKKVVEGTCEYCNKGCKAYRFKTDNLPSLPLFIEEKEGIVTDIYLCNLLKEDDSDENHWDIYFNFYEDEKVGFIPSVEHLIILQRIDKAVEGFNDLEKTGIVPIEEVVLWYKKCKLLARDLDFDNVFEGTKYKAFLHFKNLYYNASSLNKYMKENDLAKKALDKFYELDKKNEKNIVKWLLENENYYSIQIKKTKKWKKTGFLILETNPNLLIDFNGYLHGFILNEIYFNLLMQIMDKYIPTSEQIAQNDEPIECSLKSLLKLHNKYLDLL